MYSWSDLLKRLVREVSEVYSIEIMAGHGGTQADTVLEKELRVLHLNPQATGSELSTTLNIA